MNSLLTLAGTTSLFGGGSGAGTSFEQFEERIPGFGMLQSFFKTWLKVDLTTVLTIAALMGAASSGAQSLQATASKVYWWIIRFLTASISIAGHDRLNKEVLNWLGAHVLTKNGTRILTAHSERVQDDAFRYYRRVQERNDYHHEKRTPVQYLPTFGTTWFIHDRNVFMVRRILTNSAHINTSWSNRTPDEYAGAPEGDEPLVVMCLGRSVEPIKRFLHTCRDFADKQRESFVTVRTSKARHYDEHWDTTILRPLRPLETVHFDEKIKQELVADITNYLDSNTRKFYNRRGIPYRRGYLLHGPPGTGKTSLSLALAGKFGLELYLLHMPSVPEDKCLEKLFTALPPRCIVLLEDIDAVGIKRRPAKGLEETDDDKDGDESDDNSERSTRCTLSGLLNVLDGVASQEGRIVLMTSNFAEKLDKALVRPGRVDRMIYLGNISQRSSELMFCRMYSRNDGGPAPAENVAQLAESELRQLATEFSKQIPDEVFTPAQLQGYLLNYRASPADAVSNVGEWVKEEQDIMEKAKEKAIKASERRKKKKLERKLKELAKVAKNLETEAQLDALKESLKEKVELMGQNLKTGGIKVSGHEGAEKEKTSSHETMVNGKVTGKINGVNGANGANEVNGVNGKVNGEANMMNRTGKDEHSISDSDREVEVEVNGMSGTNGIQSS